MYHIRRTKEFIYRSIHSGFFNNDNKQKILSELFLESNRFLQELEVEYWLNYGTLLGYYRQKGIIIGDYDIDFGARESDSGVIFDQKHKLPSGFTLHDSSNRHYGPKLYISYKGFDADIYFYQETKEHFIPYEKTKWKNYRKPILRSNILPIKPAQFLGQSCFVPSNVENYLKSIYGNLSANAVRNKDSGFWE